MEEFTMRLCFTLTLVAAVMFAPAMAAQSLEVRVRIELLEVHCIQDTETVADSDLFYAVTAFSGGAAENSRSTLTRPIAINIDETKSFGNLERVIFDARIPVRGTIRGGLTAFNEDFSKDWTRRDAMVDKATRAVAAAVTASKDSSIVKAESILKAAFEVYDPSFLWTSRRGNDGKLYIDKDTQLGQIELNIPADGPAVETKIWKMVEKTVGANTYEYAVHYRIVRTR
jgi:hypothetical protein